MKIQDAKSWKDMYDESPREAVIMDGKEYVVLSKSECNGFTVTTYERKIDPIRRVEGLLNIRCSIEDYLRRSDINRKK